MSRTISPLSRAFAWSLLAGVLMVGCKTPTESSSIDPGRGGTGGAAIGSGGSTSGNGGAGSGGAGSGGASAGSGGTTVGSGGTTSEGTGGAGTGGSPTATGGVTGTGGGTTLPPPIDAPMSTDTSAATDGPESAHLPGRPDLKICAKDWTPEQCCAFLCSCLNTICSDSPKGKPGIGTCMNWCPKLSNMARRCHVYHCYVSISPTGGIKDHDSHCGHAADQVAGGGCPVEVYQ